MDSGFCQTSTASPAEPGGLPFVLVKTASTVDPFLMLGLQETVPLRYARTGWNTKIPLAFSDEIRMGSIADAVGASWRT